MNDMKNPLQSIGIWGGLAAVVMGVLALFGVGNTPENQETIMRIVLAIGTVVSGVMAIYGRWRAKKEIGTKGNQ